MRALSKWILALVAVVPFSLNAAESSLQSEIHYLLQQIETTDCVFNRNGSRHQGAEAVAHIQRKYDYFEDEIETAEDLALAEYAAAKGLIDLTPWHDAGANP